MGKILSALQSLAQRTARFTVAEATAIYNGLWMILIAPFLGCVVGFGTNVGFGGKMPSLLLAIFFAIAALFLWAKPAHILSVASAGVAKKIITHKNLLDEVMDILEDYLAFLKWFLVLSITFLFFMGTLSFQANPKALPAILVAAGIMWAFTWMWPHIFQGTWGRRLIYSYAVAIIAISFGSLIPGPVWVKYTHWDPVTAKPTSTEESLYKLNRARQDIADADRAKELERITTKVNSREALTAAEERFIVEAQRSQSNEKPQVSKPQAAPALTICPNASAQETHTCVVTNEWSNWIKFADGARDNGKSICFEPKMPVERKDVDGWTLWRFKVEEGRELLKYRLSPSCADVVF